MKAPAGKPKSVSRHTTSRGSSFQKAPERSSPVKSPPKPSLTSGFEGIRQQHSVAHEQEGLSRPDLQHHFSFDASQDPAALEEWKRQECHKDCLKKFGYAVNKEGHAATIMEGYIPWKLTNWYYRCYCTPTDSFSRLLQSEGLTVTRFELTRKFSLERALKYLKDNGGIEHVPYDIMFKKHLVEELKRVKSPLDRQQSYTQWVDKLNDNYAKGMPWPEEPVVG